MSSKHTRTSGKLSIVVLMMCGVLAVLVGVGGYTFYYAKGFSYLSDDPEVCVNCHIMRDHYDGWLKASHHGHATCNDCHLPGGLFKKYVSKSSNGYHHSKAFTLGDFHEPIRIRPVSSRVLNENCNRCHAQLVGEITAHLGGDMDELNCVRCHGSVGHGPQR